MHSPWPTIPQDHIRSAKRMEELNIPKIGRTSAKTLEVVHDVEWKLPGIRSELVEIRKVYDLGRLRVRCFPLLGHSLAGS